MPLVYGQALSFSPLLYRERGSWADVRSTLVGDVVQPRAADAETPECLDDYALRLNRAFRLAGERLAEMRLDALIVVVSDECRTFDDTNMPQLHVFAGDEIWGDPARPELGETPDPVGFRCEAAIASQLAEELARDGYDVSESRGVFRPVGDPKRGAVAALVAPLARLGVDVPIVPIHVNCHMTPEISGRRMAPLGAAIARALGFQPRRIGILASGGLSGQPGDAMAGWIDNVLDEWVLERLRMGRASDLGPIFDVRSQSLRGSTRHIRLWAAAGGACETAGLRASTDEYIAFHHAAAGIGFMHWSS